MRNDQIHHDDSPPEQANGISDVVCAWSLVLRDSLFVSRRCKCLLLLMVLFCSSGATCSRSFRNPFASLGPPAPDVLVPGSSLDQVIAAVNQNAARVQSYQTNNASITVPGMPSLPLLHGNIVAQRPGRVRLQASTTFTGPEVDLGRNDELFWFWVKRNEPPALYFSRHTQFAGSAAQQVMPIDPLWLLDAIGLSQFSPNDQHDGPVPHGDGTIEIRSVMQTPVGPRTKSTVIDSRRAWVLEQHIYDDTGTLLASSRARSHRFLPEAGVSLPKEIDLSLPAAQLTLTIDVGTVVVNQLAENRALWSLPVLSGFPQVDLGSAPPGAFPSVGSTGASFSSAPLQTPQPFLNEPPMAYTPSAAIAPSLPSQRPTTEQPVAQQLRPGGVPLPASAVR